MDDSEKESFKLLTCFFNCVFILLHIKYMLHCKVRIS